LASEPTDNNSDTFETTTPRVSTNAVKKGIVGRVLYVVNYVLHGIWRNKRRSLSLLVGIIIGVTLISSIFVWTDTGGRVAIDDYFNNTPFHYYVVQNPNFPNDDPNAIFPVRDFVERMDTTRETYIVRSSIALFEIGHLRPGDYYLPWPYGRGIKDCQAFFTDNDFLTRAEQSFTILDGTFRVSGNSILLSQRVVDDLDAVMGLQVGVGSSLDVAFARNYRYADQIGDLNPVYRTNFGWTDSMILSTEVLEPNDFNLMARWVMFPRLLVEANPAAFYSAGIDQTLLILDSEFNRIEQNFDIFLGGRDALGRLVNYIESYHERRTMGVLVMPMVILSLLSTTFTTTLFIAGRRPEVAILRSRGASYRQLYATFLFEFSFLAIIGLILGGFVGAIVVCLLPSASSFLVFDMNIFFQYLNLVKFEPIVWVVAGLISILPAAIYTVLITRSFLQTELYAAIRGNNSRWKISNWMRMLYVFVVVVVFWPLLMVFLAQPLSAEMALFVFILAIGFWVLLSDAIARLIKPSVASFSRIFRPLFGQKSHLFAQSVRVRRTRLVPLLIILLLTFSVTVFSAIQAQTYQGHVNRQIEYFLGSDVRVYSGPVPTTRASEIALLSQIEDATGFIELRSHVGANIEFRMLGVDPDAYATVGNWDSSSMLGDNWEDVLARLANNVDGVIFPAHIATELGKGVGDTILVYVWDQRMQKIENKTMDIVGLCLTAPGFGYTNPSSPAASISGNPGFGFQKGQPFAFCHEHFMLVELPAREPSHYVFDRTQLFLARSRTTNMQSAISAVQSLDFVRYTWSPTTFDLEAEYPDGYLFSQGVISLLSVGFLASLTISVVALTVFVNTIVQERKTEYAIMRALGGTRRQVTAIVLGEFVGLILAAFLFSMLMGIVFSQVLMQTILHLFPQPYVIPFTIVYPISLLATVLGLVVLGLIAGAYLPARRAGSIEVSTILRNL
jgi:ABC-type antimicrobial peptide transport system permease subunit